MKKLLLFITLGVIISNSAKATFYDSLKSQIFSQKRSSFLIRGTLSTIIGLTSLNITYNALVYSKFSPFLKPNYPDNVKNPRSNRPGDESFKPNDIHLKKKQINLNHSQNLTSIFVPTALASLGYSTYCFIKAAKA